MNWRVDYVVGNNYRTKYVNADTAAEAIKKANVKNIEDLNPVRYVVANYDRIPFKEQPEEGYTFEEAKARVRREIAECKSLNLEVENGCFTILDTEDHFKTVWEYVGQEV